jgi:hypothetical protein
MHKHPFVSTSIFVALILIWPFGALSLLDYVAPPMHKIQLNAILYGSSFYLMAFVGIFAAIQIVIRGFRQRKAKTPAMPSLFFLALSFVCALSVIFVDALGLAQPLRPGDLAFDLWYIALVQVIPSVWFGLNVFSFQPAGANLVGLR